ncbi:MAG: PEP-CTERM sorting domain-containing protein [Planctomycetota bacterium]|jgi:hypothetical protein
MRRIALIICLLILICSVSQAGVVDIEFQNANAVAYAEAYSPAGLETETDVMSVRVQSDYDVPDPEDSSMPPIDTIRTESIANLEYFYENGSTLNLYSDINGEVSSGEHGQVAGYTAYMDAYSTFSADLVISSTAQTPEGTPLALLVTIDAYSDHVFTTWLLQIGSGFEFDEFGVTDKQFFIPVNAGDSLSINMGHYINVFDGTGAIDSLTRINPEVLVTFEVVPEPATIFMLGFGGLVLLRKRRTHNI